METPVQPVGMNDLERKIKAYADERWPDRNSKFCIKKLGEELIELTEAIAEDDKVGILIKAADMAIVLSDICALEGESLAAWMKIKTNVLESRLQKLRSEARESINEEIGC